MSSNIQPNIGRFEDCFPYEKYRTLLPSPTGGWVLGGTWERAPRRGNLYPRSSVDPQPQGMGGPGRGGGNRPAEEGLCYTYIYIYQFQVNLYIQGQLDPTVTVTPGL